MKGEDSIAAMCRREGIHPAQYYTWSRDFLEAGKKRLKNDIIREANCSEVKGLRDENVQLKQFVSELVVEDRMLKQVLQVWNKAGSVYEILRWSGAQNQE